MDTSTLRLYTAAEALDRLQTGERAEGQEKDPNRASGLKKEELDARQRWRDRQK